MAHGVTSREELQVMQTGVVAKKVGLSVDAIRFYESNALLPRAAMSEGGFRQYAERGGPGCCKTSRDYRFRSQ
jgi:hypothetical protein